MKTGYEYYDEGLSYPCTNESILAVVSGLSLNRKDVAVLVAGSGDIPFAIAPYVDKVYAVDKNEHQLNFIREQMGLLRERDNNFFRDNFVLEESDNFFDVCLEDFANRKKYFSNKFKSVVKSLDKIELVSGNIFDVARDLGKNGDIFDRFYVSNAMDYGAPFSLCSFDDSLSGLRTGGLFYDASCSEDIKAAENYFSKSLVLDKARTIKARAGESGKIKWHPAVYRKI